MKMIDYCTVDDMRGGRLRVEREKVIYSKFKMGE
jgi:hypothetical protein